MRKLIKNSLNVLPWHLFVMMISLMLGVSSVSYAQCDDFGGTRSSLGFWDHIYENKKGKKDVIFLGSKNELSDKYDLLKQQFDGLYKSKYRPNSFHNNIKQAIDDIKDTDRKNRLLEHYSEFKRFDGAILGSFMKLAAKKHIPSFYCIGRIYEHGIGVEVDLAEAGAWYTTAFAVDGIFAQNDLDRIWKMLDYKQQTQAQKLADVYIKKYTNVPNIPSTTILN